MLNTIKKCFYAARQLTQSLGRDPSSEEIAGFMHLPEGRVRDILGLTQDTASLDSSVDNDSRTSLADLLDDERLEQPFETAFHIALQETIESVLDQLSEREKRIIQLRFGLHGEGPYTLQETGRALGITRERVRQIQEKAIAKLRHLREIEGLRDSLR
jgi:RNA polymerase primary sigma factor